MKAPMLAWMLSLTGAALFFASGVLFALYRAGRARDAASLRREGRAADSARAEATGSPASSTTPATSTASGRGRVTCPTSARGPCGLTGARAA